MASPPPSPTQLFAATLLKYGRLLYSQFSSRSTAPVRLVHTPIPPSVTSSSQPSTSQRLYIPDLLEDWPWPERSNPFFNDAVNAEELGYFYELPEVQRSKGLQMIVKKGFVPLLVALTFPNVTEAQLRAIIRFAQWAVIIDDESEQGQIDEVEQRIQGAIRTCLDPDSIDVHDDEVARGLCSLIRPMFSDAVSYGHLIDAVTNNFLPSILKQAKQHSTSTIPTIEEWLELRYDTFALDIFMPYLEFDDPISDDMRGVLSKFRRTAGRMLFLENDLYSYKKEQAAGDYHNTLVIVMHNKQVDLNGAVEWVKAEHTRLLESFLEDMRTIPSFGSPSLDDRARRWVSDLGQMVRGYVEYCFQAPRYFGKECALVKERGYVDLVPATSAAFDHTLVDPPIAAVELKAPFTIAAES